MNVLTKDIRAYIILTALVICGLACSIVTAPKVVHWGINFPFSNLVFSIFTYPIVDCICELWGKKAARQTVLIGLGSQLLISLLIYFSIVIPHADYWTLQTEYQTILSVSGLVVLSSLLAFGISQLLDIFIYQRIKEACAGKWLWLRSNTSIFLGQIVDSSIFVLLVFHASDHKFNILLGSIIVKIVLAILMTPVIYCIVLFVNHYLEGNTLAFKGK